MFSGVGSYLLFYSAKIVCESFSSQLVLTNVSHRQENIQYGKYSVIRKKYYVQIPSHYVVSE